MQRGFNSILYFATQSESDARVYELWPKKKGPDWNAEKSEIHVIREG